MARNDADSGAGFITRSVRRRLPVWLSASLLQWRSIRKNPIAVVSALFLLFACSAAVLADVVAPYDPYETDILNRINGPSADHWLGTDNVGRDVLSRMIHGARPTMAIAIISVLLSGVLGLAIGLTTGYFRGVSDLLIQRVMDAIQAFPGLIAAILIIAVLGPSTENVIIPLTLIFTPGTARVVRASTLVVRQSDYVTAAIATGAPTWRVILRHILPNILAPILVVSSVVLGYAIIVEASLGFLGLGVQPPAPSWGGILAQDGRIHFAEHPYLVIVPSLAISLTVLAVNILGDAIRDATDPIIRRSA